MASQTENSTSENSENSPEVISLEQLIALTEKHPDERLEFLGIVPVEPAGRAAPVLAKAETLDAVMTKDSKK